MQGIAREIRLFVYKINRLWTKLHMFLYISLQNSEILHPPSVRAHSVNLMP